MYAVPNLYGTVAIDFELRHACIRIHINVSCIGLVPQFRKRLSKKQAQMNSKKVKGPHEDLTYQIIGVGMAVHRQLGPGYKEIVYQRSLELALTENGISFDPQQKLPVYNNGNLLGYYIPDFIIENKVILEIKAFATVHQKYLGQVITYLNHTGLPIGLLMNFGERSLRTRRVFPSPPATEFRHNHQWIFVPDWLKEQKRNQTEDLPF